MTSPISAAEVDLVELAPPVNDPKCLAVFAITGM